ncbi:hypothetical protein [Microbacterium sp. SS28]|uniref:hypothetical protein n=1 Tax=Microbacterium sp. SS28 TaxID=2919948 RepID=UPI001FAA3CC0|nr:hypothetical protein [Microbacterium sp. SS28]
MIALATAFLLLTGCAASSGSRASEPTGSPDPPDATEEPAAEVVEPAIPLELTFEEGDALEPGSIAAEWTDPFANNPDFSLLSPDEGNGSWSYTDDTNGCTVGFYQGTLTDFAPEPTDEASTISAIAAIAAAKDDQITAEIVETYGDDFPVEQTQEGGEVSLWGLGADLTDGSSWVDSARFFNAIGSIQYVTIQCPAGVSAYDEHDRVVGPVGLRMHVTEAAGE